MACLKQNSIRRSGRKDLQRMGYEAGLEQGIAQGLEQGIAQGLEQGQKQKAEQTCRKMLQLGLSLEIIQKSTELSEEEILSIKEAMKL